MESQRLLMGVPVASRWRAVLDGVAAFAEKDEREVVVVVPLAVAVAAAVGDERVVEDGAVAFLDVVELVQHIAEERQGGRR
jgi:hypothetical protein